MCSIVHGHLSAIFVALIYNPPGVFLTDSDVIDNTGPQKKKSVGSGMETILFFCIFSR